MSLERERQVEQVFQDALDIPDEDRGAFLARVCSDDPELRSEVELLLAHDVQARGVFLETPAEIKQSASETFLQPRMIGPYRIIREIGAGGMGVVYEAEQDRPKRTVAVKAIRLVHASSEAIRRFQREAELLGQLHHPGIAHIYDAGVATIGEMSAGPLEQPYLAMEFIQGESIHQYAWDRELGTREILELGVAICEAVDHAHSKGVVHRDLKPTNILINEQGMVKVLDFGIARATDHDPEASTLRTRSGQLLGTLPYMSPEQVAGDPTAIDHRTDVYAIGVILYELLSRKLPFDVRDLSVVEAARQISQEEPTHLGRIDTSFRGDVSIIVHKAIEKDRSRRYPSAAELRDDIDRYLEQRSIVARPPSTFYQLRRFAARNRAIVGGVVATLLTLMIGAAVATREAIRATDEAERTTTALEEVRKQKKLAEDRLTESRNAREESDVTVEFLRGMLIAVTPEDLGRDVLVRDVLDRASRGVDEEFADRPTLLARLCLAIGRAYMGLGLLVEAAPHLARAREILVEENDRTQSERIAEAEYSLALCVRDRDPDQAAIYLQSSLERLRNQRGLFDEYTLNAERELAESFARAERFDEADEAYRAMIEKADRMHGPDSDVALRGRINLAQFLIRLDRLVEAETFVTDVVDAVRSSEAPDESRLLQALDALAQLRQKQGRHDEAGPIFRELVEKRTSLYGESHPMTLQTMNAFGSFLFGTGQRQEAKVVYEQVLARGPAAVGEDHPSLLVVRCNLARVYLSQGRIEDARTMVKAGLDALGSESQTSEVAEGMWSTYGSIQFGERNFEAAEKSFARSLEILESTFDPEQLPCQVARVNRASALKELGRFEEAEGELLLAQRVFRGQLGDDHPSSKYVASLLIECYRAWGREDDADRIRRGQ